MSATIVKFEEKYLIQVRDIFFESSVKKQFKDSAEKDSFFEKYVGFYLLHYPDLCFVAIGKQVLGYVVASPVSNREELFHLQPHLEIFKGCFHRYPGHLHINCHHESRGQGIGAKLVSAVESHFKSLKIQGWHIMTGPESQNRNFYKKLGFDFELELGFNESRILLMGKSLSED